MTDLVLDAWAIIAWLKDQQPAADRVNLLLASSERGEGNLFMNIVNLGEVFYIVAKARGPAFGERVLRNLYSRVVTVSASDELVMSAAALKAKHPISYADAFAAATALSLDLPLVTGDPELQLMAEKDPTLRLEWIGD